MTFEFRSGAISKKFMKRKYEMRVRMECHGRIIITAESAEEAERLWREENRGTLRIMEGASRNKIHWQRNGPFELAENPLESQKE